MANNFRNRKLSGLSETNWQRERVGSQKQIDLQSQESAKKSVGNSDK